MAATGLSQDEYRWRWKYRVRQLFDLATPDDGAGNREDLTDDQIRAYVAQNSLIEDDLRPRENTGRTQNKLNGRVNTLKNGLGIARGPRLADVPMPIPADQRGALAAVFPDDKMPTRARMDAVRGKAPGASAGPRKRPEGISDATTVVDPQPLTSVTLPADASNLFTYIKEADVRNLTRELSDPAYDPEQTIKVTITPIAAGAVAIPDISVTPLQYAALAGLKGVVRLILQRSTPNVSKKINNLKILEAIKDYRSNDVDKNEVDRIFKIVTTSVQDAVDDFSGGVSLDSKYGDALTKDIDKKLAKTIYDREYKELESPKPLPVTAPKTTSKNVEEAKKKGKEDGEAGSSMNPEYATKTAQEKEAYGKEYDKSRAKFQGQKDGVLGETGGITNIESELSEYYRGPDSVPTHVEEVKKIYKDAYEANKNKESDLAKEAGYVGKYLSVDSLSGNYFGFGSDLNKIIGFDVESSDVGKESENQYQEGFAEFLKEYKTLIGQAKYAGYTDGRNKNAKYTSLGKIKISDKQYPVDFGKLNTTIKTQPELDATSKPAESPDYKEAQRILVDMGTQMNTVANIDDLFTWLKTRFEDISSPKIKQLYY